MAALPELAWVAAILFGAACFQGFLGFGFGILAMSALTLGMDLLHAQGVVNLGGLFVTVGVAWTLRRHLLWQRVWRMLPTIVIGVVLGVTALRTLDTLWMERALGATIVGIAIWNLARPSLVARETPFWDAATGLASGVLSGAFNTGGPPLIAHLYRLDATPIAVKATVQVLFVILAGIRAPIAASQGLMGVEILRDTAISAPFIVLGLWLGVRLGHRIDPALFRRASWVALGALGVVFLVR